MIALIRLVVVLVASCLVAACQSTPSPSPAAPAAAEQVVPQPPAECRQGATDWVWMAPSRMRADTALRLIAVSTAGALEGLYLTDPSGLRRPFPATAAGGPPWSLIGVLERPVSGRYRIEAVRGARVMACAEIDTTDGAGRSGGDWDLAHQALFAVWVEHLFDAPPGQSLGFDSLQPVLRDPERNLLHDFLAPGEDALVPAEPDCADLPYFLRAYFAWKLGLPVAYRSCTRGSRGSPPRCGVPVIETGPVDSRLSSADFSDLGRRLMDAVHSGCGRTALADDATDFYPVPLRRDTLWPGTVFADPYGHTLVLVKWVPQTPARPGMLLAVDAQPDNSVARKRFWEGTFLFAETPSAGAGFKTYRPPVGRGRAVRTMTNAELARVEGVPPYSAEQAGLTPDDFYARMEGLINPDGLDPEAAYAATLAALMEQLQARVDSVARGEAYMHAHRAPPMQMPEGAAIFETTGPWEDYATPSRDMRLLIAMKVLEDLPGHVRRHPELYRLGGRGADEVAGVLQDLHSRRARERFITYTRSDGSAWRLSLAEVYRRRPGIEVGYNPNDCIELRWGAAPGSPDYATCGRHAPPAQRERMERYRPWFAETRRPAR